MKECVSAAAKSAERVRGEKKRASSASSEGGDCCGRKVTST